MLSDQEEKELFIAHSISILSNKVEFALLFGSIVTGRMTPESDIDIAIYCKESFPGYETVNDVKNSLFSSTNRDIDLVVLNSSDIVITMQILANGIILLQNNPGLFILFKARKISEYIDFKIDRKIIEDNLLRGRIFA